MTEGWSKRREFLPLVFIVNFFLQSLGIVMVTFKTSQSALKHFRLKRYKVFCSLPTWSEILLCNPSLFQKDYSRIENPYDPPNSLAIKMCNTNLFRSFFPRIHSGTDNNALQILYHNSFLHSGKDLGHKDSTLKKEITSVWVSYFHWQAITPGGGYSIYYSARWGGCAWKGYVFVFPLYERVGNLSVTTLGQILSDLAFLIIKSTRMTYVSLFHIASR